MEQFLDGPILLVEDSPTQAAEISAHLESRGCTVHIADTLSAAIEAIGHVDPAVILLDLGLPDAEGISVVERMRAAAARVPIVVLSALEDEQTALLAVQRGAQDYLFKAGCESALLVRSIRYAIERARAEQALQQRYDELETILNSLRVGTMMLDASGCLTFISRACHPFLPRPAQALIGRPWQEAIVTGDEHRSRLAEILSSDSTDIGKTRIAISGSAETQSAFHLDIEVQADISDPQKRILYLYDITEVLDLRDMVAERGQLEEILGRSEAILDVFHLIRQVAPVDLPVLIEGATGTGKELVARAVHNLSPRKSRPFVAVNCAGLSESLLTSQLFGHKRGAFTGAVTDSVGLFAAADGGTIFLDEIGDMPLSVQTAVLRVLQESEVLRVGDTVSRKINVRVVSATNRDLSLAIQQGSFRSDLLYRIRVARILLPPLRDRQEDIPVLAGSFLEQFSIKTGKRITGFTPAALVALLSYDWPGNIRELRGVVDFAALRCSRDVVDISDFPPEVLTGDRKPLLASPRRAASSVGGAGKSSEDERSRFLEALRQTNGSRTEAAKLLGMGRSTFYRRLEALGLDLDD